MQCLWQQLEGAICVLVSNPAHSDISDCVCSLLRVMVLKITVSWGSQGRTFLAFIRPERSWAGTMGCLRTGT